MNNNREKYEIMAPVGSRESLAAAIHAGAQSVYFGIGQLNMRAHSASTFGIDDLKDIALTNPDADIDDLITYMDDEWPCSRIIKESVKERIEERRKDVVPL